jgi:hypothetical protein
MQDETSRGCGTLGGVSNGQPEGTCKRGYEDEMKNMSIRLPERILDSCG